MLDNGSDMHDTNGSFNMNRNKLSDAWTPEIQQSVQNTWMERISILR